MNSVNRRNPEYMTGQASKKTSFGRVGMNQIRLDLSDQLTDLPERPSVGQRRHLPPEMPEHMDWDCPLPTRLCEKTVLSRGNGNLKLRSHAVSQGENVNLRSATFRSCNEIQNSHFAIAADGREGIPVSVARLLLRAEPLPDRLQRMFTSDHLT